MTARLSYALSPNPSPTDQRPPRLRLCGSAKTRGFPHESLHSLSTTTTANPSSHQPSKWPRNAPVSLLAPTVATYVHSTPLPASSQPSGLNRSSFFPESIRAEGSSWSYRQFVQQQSRNSKWDDRNYGQMSENVKEPGHYWRESRWSKFWRFDGQNKSGIKQDKLLPIDMNPRLYIETRNEHTDGVKTRLC